MRLVQLILALVLVAGCSEDQRSSPTTVSGSGSGGTRLGVDPPAAPDWRPVIAALQSGGRMTMRRIDGEGISASNGQLFDKTVYFGRTFYRVLSDEHGIARSEAEAIKASLVRNLQHPTDTNRMCGFDPGLFLTLYRITEEGQEQIAGYGAVCLHCDAWIFSFRSDRDVFIEDFPSSIHDLVLHAALSAFPEDASLQEVRRRDQRTSASDR
jgi:hypothetical protein